MNRVFITAVAVIAFAGCILAGSGANSSLKQPAFEATQASPINVGPMPGEPAVADCNGDGFPDIVLACGTCCGSRPSPLSGHVQVLLGNGQGGFTQAEGSPIPIGSSARKVALGDANGDGTIDIFVAQHDSYEVVILLGDGRGEFRVSPHSPVIAGSGPRPHTHDISAGDVNGDGKIDIVTTNSNDNNISVLLGDGAGRFAHAPGSPVPAGRHPYDVVALHDVNLDGKLDIITPNLAGNAVMVMLGDGKAGFTPSKGAPFAAETRPGYLAVDDLNGDGKPDIVATHDDYPLVVVLLGDGKGGFKPAAWSPIRPPHPVWGIAVGDVNGDGKKDLALGAQLDNGLVIMLGDGTGNFVAADNVLPAGRRANYVALADLNKSGKLDIVAGNYGSGDITVLLNRTR